VVSWGHVMVAEVSAVIQEKALSLRYLRLRLSQRLFPAREAQRGGVPRLPAAVLKA
jgi:hypothetical protein